MASAGQGLPDESVAQYWTFAQLGLEPFAKFLGEVWWVVSTRGGEVMGTTTKGPDAVVRAFRF